MVTFDIQQRETEGITILDLKGRLAVGEAVGRLRDRLTTETANGVQRLILNLAGVDSIDSTGLGTLVMCFTQLQRQGGSLKLARLNKRNIELLVLTKLSTVFEVFPEEQDAINSFFPERAIQRFDILSFVQTQKDN